MISGVGETAPHHFALGYERVRTWLPRSVPSTAPAPASVVLPASMVVTAVSASVKLLVLRWTVLLPPCVESWLACLLWATTELIVSGELGRESPLLRTTTELIVPGELR